MPLSGVETQQSPVALVPSSQDRREVSATRTSSDAPVRNKERPESRGPSPIQDQVTLSKEAQTLSVSDSQPSKNSTFQQSPSPFDK